MRIFLSGLMAAICFSTAAFGGSKDLQSYGDIMQRVLPAFALGTTIYRDDEEGMRQWFRSAVGTVVMLGASKEAFNNTSWGERPHGNGDKSFPSGHTTYACQGAAFLGQRYGWEMGLPAFGAAALVGYSRVNAGKHHWRDVIGGCALSYGVSQLFVTKEGEENIIPVVGPDFIGLRLHFESPF